MEKKRNHKVKNWILYGGLTHEEFISIKKGIYVQNLHIWRILSAALAILFLGLALFNSSTNADFGLISMPQFVMGIIAAIGTVLLNFQLAKKYIPWLLWLIIYVLSTTLLVTGLILGFSDHLEAPMVTFIVLLIGVPIVIADAPWQTIILLLAAVAGAIVASLIYKTGYARTIDIYDVIVFGIVSVLLHYYIVRFRFRGMLAEVKLQEALRTDALTSCKNEMAYIEERASIDKSIAEKTKRPFAIIMFDVNGIKYIDDTFGHSYGCALIVEAGHQLKELFSHGSSVFHLGGDEFMVILKGDDFKNREALCKAFEEKNENNFIHHKDQDLRLSIAYGISDYTPEDPDFHEVLTRADSAMYANKKIVKKRQGIKSRAAEDE